MELGEQFAVFAQEFLMSDISLGETGHSAASVSVTGQRRRVVPRSLPSGG